MGIQTKAQPLVYGSAPASNVGPRAFQQAFDFTATASIPYTLATDMTRGIDSVQSVFMDNSNSSAPLYLVVAVTGEQIVCPPYSQGFFPVLFPQTSNFQCTVKSAGAVVVPIQFLNFTVDLNIWSVATPQGLGVQTVQGSVNVLPSPGAWTDASGTIATAATSQLLLPANGARKKLYIRNPGTANGQNIAGNLEPLYFNMTGAAGVEDGVSWELLPGEVYDTQAGPVSTQAITINAATAGHRFIAKYM